MKGIVKLYAKRTPSLPDVWRPSFQYQGFHDKKFMHQSIRNGCREKSEVQAFTKACIQFTTSARDHRASISKDWCWVDVAPGLSILKGPWQKGADWHSWYRLTFPKCFSNLHMKKTLLKSPLLLSRRLTRNPLHNWELWKSARRFVKFRLMTVDGVPGPESHLFAGLHHCLLQCRAEPHFLHPDGLQQQTSTNYTKNLKVMWAMTQNACSSA